VGLGDYGGKRGGVKLINLPWEGTDIFLWNNIMEKNVHMGFAVHVD